MKIKPFTNINYDCDCVHCRVTKKPLRIWVWAIVFAFVFIFFGWLSK